jgi:hypothetical protein
MIRILKPCRRQRKPIGIVINKLPEEKDMNARSDYLRGQSTEYFTNEKCMI